MNGGAAILTSVIGGAISGGIGAAAARDSGSPILKGAVIAGLINGAITGVFVLASYNAREQLKTGTAGVGELHLLSHPGFP